MAGYRVIVGLLVFMLANGAVADMRELLPGDTAPELRVAKWLQKGTYDSVQPVGSDGKLITVIEFWADWCPLSRIILPIHDHMQVGLRDHGVRFIAVAEGQHDSIQTLLKQLKLRNFAVAYDEDGALFETFLGSISRVPMPFAVVVEESSKLRQSRVLWAGPSVNYKGSDAWDDGYTSRLEDVLASIIANRYDVDTERELKSKQAELMRIRDRIQDDAQNGRIEEITALAKQAMAKEWPTACNNILASALAISSWFLLSSNEPTAEQISDGLMLVQSAMKMQGKEQPSLLHVYALALFAGGNIESAAATEKRAIESPVEDNSFPKEMYLDALARYTKALTGDKSSSEAKPIAPEVPKAPAPSNEMTPPDKITSEQAASDLLGLHEHLHLNYAAYDDIAWTFACEGSSWDKHNAVFLEKIKARKEWRVCEFFDLVTEYLKVAPDRHLNIEGKFSRDGEPRHEQSRPTGGVFPFFADVRVREQNGQMVLLNVESISIPSGASITDVSIIDSPLTAKSGKVYLFPTLPLESAGAKEYLLGVLAEPTSAPGPIKVTIADPTGSHKIELPVHRGKQECEWKRDPAWALDLKPIPILTVRRMWGDGLDGLLDTAAQLRDLPLAVLDFRSNGGGSDSWASQWVQSFCAKSYIAYRGAAEMRRGQTEPLRRWSCHAGITSGSNNSSGTHASKTYTGKLFVITGAGCASSGETFTNLASQIPGAVLVGENTAGFVTYGNIDQLFKCPHAGVTVHFSRTKFATGKRPVIECMGMFPDYWLDGKDPTAAITAYCSL